MDQEGIRRAVRDLLRAIGEDAAREGIQGTPDTVAKAALELYAGYGEDPAAQIELIEGPDNLIVMRDVPFFSTCEHHLLPFFGRAQLAVLPQGGRIAGFGSLAHIVDACARKLQIQERLTEEIADALWRGLRPQGVYVSLQAQQLCMQMVGGRELGAVTVTVAARGALVEGPLRQEAVRLLGAGA
ncbi:MAG: GTP cyclohydrolase I [Thermaerobacter sp.]|nr:GTP cyclohydrolase I [Thermaerobacter sp.]